MSRIFRLPPYFLPSVKLEDCDRLPRKAGVYYAIEPSNPWKPLYIGMSGDMRSRWEDHHKYDRLARRGSVRLHYRSTFTRSGAEYLESCDIRTFDPPMNDKFESCPMAPLFWVFDRIWDGAIALGLFGMGAVLMSAFTPSKPVPTIATIEVSQLANIRETPNGVVMCEVKKGDRLPMVLASGETEVKARSKSWILVKACGGKGLIFKEMTK